ncbi:MAG: Panacea domain-containing protein [Mycobacteriales bacterium]
MASVADYDAEVDCYEDDEPLECVSEIADRPPTLTSVAPLSVLDVAAALLQRLGDTDTYRLQKLCYYAQAQHVALFSTRLFAEPIEAWPNGPVVRALWNHHARRRRIAELAVGDATKVESEPAAVSTLDYVVDRYGAWSGAQLSEMTHREKPWVETRQGLRSKEPSDREIPLATIRDYYRAFDDIEPVDDPDPKRYASGA